MKTWVTDRFSLVNRYITQKTQAIWTQTVLSRTWHLLRMNYIAHFLWCVLPGEPWGTSGKEHSQRSLSLVLWTLDSFCLETSIALEIENSDKTSVEIMCIYHGSSKSSGHNYTFISLLRTVGILARQVHSWGEHWLQSRARNSIEFKQVRIQLCMAAGWKRKYLCGSAAHLVLGSGDGVHWNWPPQ